MAVEVFSVDAEAVKEVLEDLVEALDVCGYHKPLENWEQEGSTLRRWLHSIDDLDEDKTPSEVLAEWKEQLKLLDKSIRGARNIDIPRALGCLKQAAEEFLECCTFEE